MKMRWMQKTRLLWLALAVCCTALAAAGSLAYVANQETARNVITTARLEMTLHEETDGGAPFPADGVVNVLPDSRVEKRVYVENSGEAAFWCRIRIEKSIQAAEGVDAQLNFDHIALDLNTDAWTERGGYYYYNAPLKPGECSLPLFTQLRFGGELGNEYVNARLAVRVHAQVVQSRNNGANALEAAGWPEEES